jgi:ABC-2 type transport system ATP-binding protein
VTEAAVVLADVRKTFAHVAAVAGISAEVPRGSIYGVLGPNGAGKTTTLRMIVGILRPDSGRVVVLDETDPAAIKRRLGYLPEEKGLYKKMRVEELVVYFGRLKHMTRADAKREAAAALERFGLSDWRRERCESLSKGMGQKVQIIGTLLHGPELIVLDEPFSGLDPVNVELVRDVILEQKRANRTVLISTHVMEQAEQICDALMLINHGRKLIDGSLGDVRARAEGTLVIDYEGDGAVLQGLPGVTRVNDAGRHAELSLAHDADTDAILAALVGRLHIRRFDTRESSLHEIFVRAVRADDAH